MSKFSPASVLYGLVGATWRAVTVIEDGSEYLLRSASKAAQKADTSLHYLGITNAGGLRSALEDAAGNALASVQDGSSWLLRAASKVALQDTTLKYLTMNAGGSIAATLYDKSGNPIAFPVGTSDAGLWVEDYVRNGSSDDLLVDGSSTPVSFSYNADASKDIALNAITIALVSNTLSFGAENLGAVNALTNGVEISIDQGGNSGVLAIIKQNEDFLHVATPGGFQLLFANKDVISAIISLGGGVVLEAGSSDKVTVKIQDDLSSAGDYFRASVQGVKEA